MTPPAVFALALVVKATLLLAVAGVLALALRRASAATRHLVWAAALAGALALPVLAAVLPGLRVPLPALPAAPVSALAPLPAPVSTATEPRVAVQIPEEAPAAAPMIAGETPGDHPSTGVLMFTLWLLGAAAVLLRLALGRRGIRRLARRAEPVADSAWTDPLRDAMWLLDVHRPVALLRSAAATMPMTWGTRRPTVLLPAAADGWPAERRRSTLLHELAHVARRDCLTQALAEVACALYWFHPGVWYAAGRLRAERERACDDRVLAAGEPASDYAAHLLEVARTFRTGRLLAPAALAMARPSQLEGRLLAILDATRSRRAPGPRLLAGGAALALVLVFPLAAMRGAEAAPPSEEGIGANVFGTPAASQEPFRWRGTIPRGQTLEIRGVLGPITATRATGNETEVVAVRRTGERGDPERIRFETIRHARGVTICAVYPSGNAARPNRCRAESDGEINIRDFDAEVHWTVRVPAGVALHARTVDGDVRATGLASDVRAATVDGDVHVATTGAAEAATVDGDIVAELGRVTGPLRFATVDGGITVILPEGTDARVAASTLDGEILADFPLTLRKRQWVGRAANATLGRGGPEVTLKTIDGDIRLHRGRGGALRPAAASAADRLAAPRAAVVPPRVPDAPASPPPPPPVRDADWEAHFEQNIEALVEGSVETALHATSAALAAIQFDSLVAHATAEATSAALTEVDVEEVRREVERETRREFADERVDAKREAVLEVIRSAREASSDAERTALLAWAATQPEISEPAVRAAWEHATERLPERERRRLRSASTEPGR